MSSWLSPAVAILVSTLFWGTLWIPLRRLDDSGPDGPSLTVVAFCLPLLALAPWAVARRRAILAAGRPLFLGGLLMAAGVALYAEGLLRGHVARVILLFYLTPVWSTLLAWWYLAEDITGARQVAIVLGLLGMSVVFATDAPDSHASGDWMGLLAGIVWAFSLVRLRSMSARVATFDRVFVLFAWLGVLFVALSFVPGGRTWAVPTADSLMASAPWLLALGLVWMPAVLWLTMYGASRLDPGRVSVLLMLEVVIGLVSAAALADEPFGPREMAGAALILAACGSELAPFEA